MYKMTEPQKPVLVFVPILFSVVGALLAALFVAHFVTKIPFAQFTADPAGTFNYNPVFGYISNVGIMLWCAAATSCFLSAGILNMNKGKGQTVRFLVGFGILTTILMLDDLFMFHESLAPEYLNISEKWVLLAYGAYSAACFYHFRRVIMTNDIRYLIVAIAALGSSVVVDQIASKFYFPGEYFVEDGLKLIGIASWLAYFITLAFTNIMASFTGSVNRITKVRNIRDIRNHQFIYN